ncbi:hypothetical protein LELG_04612 [Lodderomyces elongisporus NRRL YB-4239]|uniref:SIS domain-containing protein n=1 Tax=Lodderomyces elongisporus (strain ATCC 11503 / CBS 2605 / JCM 1781 / NBRC 1676 / NRRL YB-4239) TaxID=379508 RepID=A5E4S3_LODEL|nr:hypothetical protein LELG_04612 [Lodderomyces elongisporus NRRL YB-4239]
MTSPFQSPTKEEIGDDVAGLLLTKEDSTVSLAVAGENPETTHKSIGHSINRPHSSSSTASDNFTTAFVQSSLNSITNTLRLENEAVNNLYNQYQTDEFSITNLLDSIALMFKTYQRKGKIIICGIGKSHKLATKLTATLNSLSISSCNLHPSEALHGDLGMINESLDCLIMLTSSGNTPELLNLLPHLSTDLPIILLTCNKVSKLSKSGRIRSLIYAELLPMHNEEAIHGLPAPTVSTTLSLILADSVILALSELIENDLFKRRKLFGLKHPGGSIGLSLNKGGGGGGSSSSSSSSSNNNNNSRANGNAAGEETNTKFDTNAASTSLSSFPQSEISSATSLLSLKVDRFAKVVEAFVGSHTESNQTSIFSENMHEEELEMYAPPKSPLSEGSSAASASGTGTGAGAGAGTGTGTGAGAGAGAGTLGGVETCKLVTHDQILNVGEFDILQWMALYDTLRIQGSPLQVKFTQIKEFYREYCANRLSELTKTSLIERAEHINHWNTFKWNLLRSFK